MRGSGRARESSKHKNPATSEVAIIPKPIPPFTLVNMIRELVEGKVSKTILLSEDDEVTRYLLGETLAKYGFRVLEARNGREAIKMAESYLPDAMFLESLCLT